MIKDLITPDDFISFYEAIPEDKWCVKRLHSLDGKSCAIGHLGEDTENSTRIINLFFDELEVIITDVNDGLYQEYDKPTPKQRILNALYEIRDMENIKT